MIPLLIDVAKIMDELFWFEAYGDKQALIDGLSDDTLKLYANINYGPWDRLNGNTSFVDGIGEKPLGANGSRRLQLKNAMRAKFDKILMPISQELITPEQRKHITFDAFFSNTMFHEVAHGLGIKNTIDGKGTVRKALKEHASALEEGKADILGLYMITQLHEKGELTADIKDYYVTFMTSIFRSVRFGASSSHGKVNMIRFNFFKEKGAFERLEDGTYRVNFENLQTAANENLF